VDKVSRRRLSLYRLLIWVLVEDGCALEPDCLPVIMDAIGRNRCHEQLLDERTHHLEKEGKILLQGSDYGTSLLLTKAPLCN